MTLPYDYARCSGMPMRADSTGTIAYMPHDCIACLRRTSPGRPEWQAYIAPHAGPGPCPNRITTTPRDGDYLDPGP
jgi:hypothetical protein